MTRFTDFRNQVYAPGVPEITRATVLDHVEDLKTQNAIICAIFIMLYSDYFLATRVYEEKSKFDHDRFWYNKKFKCATENFISAVNTHDRQICKMFEKKMPKGFSEGFADMCDSIDNDMLPLYNALVNAIQKRFEEEHLERAKDLAIIYGMGTLATIALMVEMDLAKAIPELKDNFDRYVSVKKIVDKANEMLSRASEKTPQNVKIDLNKDLLVHSKVHAMKRKFADHMVFARAFRAGGFQLEFDENELHRLQKNDN